MRQPVWATQIENTARRRIIRLFGKKSSEQEIRDGLVAVFPRLWRYALVLTSNRAAADDLAQATCCRALEKADSYQQGTHLDRWLFTIAHRMWLNDLRANAVRRGGGLQAVEDIDLPGPGPDVETNYFAREVLHRVNALPEAQRACVLLVYVEGFKYAEAAGILDVPIGTVMSRLAAARKTVVAQMSDKGAKFG